MLAKKMMMLFLILIWTVANGSVALGETQTSSRVTITGEQVHIEADNLIYDTETGVIEATGSVKVTTKDMVYHTESITYNMQNSIGVMTDFRGTIQAEPRGLKMTGASVTLSGETTSINKVALTRCELEDPHYQFSAKEITVQGRIVHLERAVLRIKGVPVFYLPRLTLNFERKMPDFKFGYSNKDGLKYAFDYLAQISANSSWFITGDLTAKGDSSVGFGLESSTQGYDNRLEFEYNFDNFWAVKDRFSYENSAWLLTADVLHEFSDEGEKQYGLKLTRKYWETVLGEWQIAFLTRDVSKEVSEDDHLQKYGGMYTGWQVDYRPHPNVVLSYLGIDSHSQGDYGDLLEDYGLGDNWLYDIRIPFYSGYAFGVNGVYNSDDTGWIHQVYSFHKESCCFKTGISYDTTEDSFELSFGIKF